MSQLYPTIHNSINGYGLPSLEIKENQLYQQYTMKFIVMDYLFMKLETINYIQQ